MKTKYTLGQLKSIRKRVAVAQKMIADLEYQVSNEEMKVEDRLCDLEHLMETNRLFPKNKKQKELLEKHKAEHKVLSQYIRQLDKVKFI